MLSILHYQKNHIKRKISQEKFDIWYRQFVFQALYGMKLGHQFCQDHEIMDFLLIHVYDNVQAIEHIKQHYIID